MGGGGTEIKRSTKKSAQESIDTKTYTYTSRH